MSSLRTSSWARRGGVAFCGLALLAGIGVVVLTSRAPAAEVTASSSDAAYPAEQLASAPADPARPLRWRTADQSVGTSVTVRWTSAVRIGRIEARAPADPSLMIRSAFVSVSDGSSLIARPDARGDILLSFTPRQASWATLTVTTADGTAVGLSSLRFSDDGTLPTPFPEGPLPNAVAAVSSSLPGTTAAGLVDAAGELAFGDTGAVWTSETAADSWAEVSWGMPREVTSVQIYGAAGTAGAVSAGRLEFSDGSAVAIAGVAAGNGAPTTIAFMPRVASSLRLVMSSKEPVTLREIAVFERGQTPPAQPVTAGASILSPAAAAPCAAPATRNTDLSRLRLICPGPGTQVDGPVRVIVAAPPGSLVSATATVTATDTELERTVGQAVSSAAGYAEVDVDVRTLARGPATVRMNVSSVDRPLHVQLFNIGGTVDRARPVPQSIGMTLAWADEFRSPLSISRTGHGAVYAATKPEFTGPADFGAAIFADPAWGTENVGTVDNEYLRIRVNDRPREIKDPSGYDRAYVGGMVSSAAVGGSGFSAQYGYFEARMLGAPGQGTWPAFWAMSTGSLADGSASTGEVDAVELYGHDTSGACQAIHGWVGPQDSPQVDCDAKVTDWAMGWHTYGARVTPTGTTFFVDGVEVAAMQGLINADEPFYFMVNLAMGGGWPTDITPTGGIVDAYVDYVRVYT